VAAVNFGRPFTFAAAGATALFGAMRRGAAVVGVGFVTLGGGTRSGGGIGAGSGEAVGTAVVASVVDGTELVGWESVAVSLVVLLGGGSGSSTLAASAAP
jgi:hypothetical protein